MARTHGLAATYNNGGCRCQPCRAAVLVARQAYRASPAGRLADGRENTRRWRQHLHEGMARKADLIRQLEAQLGLTPQEVSMNG